MSALVLVGPVVEPVTVPGRDRALQTARRLDWRFLLPDPRLGRVAYLGPGRDALVGALRVHHPSLVVDPPDDAGRGVDPAGAFDVAVVQAATPCALARAAALLDSGGWLYAELGSPAGASVGERRLRRPSRLRGLLASLGMGDVSLHWHRPDFGQAARILPLDDDAADAFVASSGGAAYLRTRLARALARAVVRPPLLVRLAPCVSVVARKADGG